MHTLCYPLELAKVKAQVDPSYYLRLRYRELTSSNKFMGAFTPHVAKGISYFIGLELLKFSEIEIFKIDIQQQGIFRKMLSNFVPVAFALGITNVFDVIKICKMSSIEKIEVKKTTFSQDFRKVVINKHLFHGVFISILLAGGLSLFE